MSYRDYYPAGAADDPSAPYNQRDPEPITREVEATFTVSKRLDVETTDYEAEYDDEIRAMCYDTMATDWQSAYHEVYYDPCQLLALAAKLLSEYVDPKLLKHSDIMPYKAVIDEAGGWEVVDEQFEEV